MNNNCFSFLNRAYANNLFESSSVAFGKFGIRRFALRESIFADSFRHRSDVQINVSEIVRRKPAEHGIRIDRRFFVGGLYSLHIGKHRTRIIRKFVRCVVFVRCIRNFLKRGRKRNIFNGQTFKCSDGYGFSAFRNGEGFIGNFILISTNKRFISYAADSTVFKKFAFLVIIFATFRKFEIGRNGYERINASGNVYGKRERAHSSVITDHSFHIIAPKRIDNDLKPFGKFERFKISHIPERLFKHFKARGQFDGFEFRASLKSVDILNAVCKIRIDRRIALIDGCRIHSRRNGEVRRNHVATFNAVNRYVFGQERNCRKSLDILKFFRIARLIIETDDRIIVCRTFNLLICKIG